MSLMLLLQLCGHDVLLQKLSYSALNVQKVVESSCPYCLTVRVGGGYVLKGLKHVFTCKSRAKLCNCNCDRMQSQSGSTSASRGLEAVRTRNPSERGWRGTAHVHIMSCKF